MRVDVEDDEIVVTKLVTSYMLAYAKPRRNSLLFVKRSWVAADAASPAISEFRAQAFQAAQPNPRRKDLQMQTVHDHPAKGA